MGREENRIEMNGAWERDHQLLKTGNHTAVVGQEECSFKKEKRENKSNDLQVPKWLMKTYMLIYFSP